MKINKNSLKFVNYGREIQLLEISSGKFIFAAKSILLMAEIGS